MRREAYRRTNTPARGRVFRRLLAVVFVMAAGPVAVSTIVSLHYVERSSVTIASTYSRQSLTHKRVVLDGLVQEVRRVAVDLSFSDLVLEFVRAEELDAREQIVIRDLSRLINGVVSAHDVIESVYIYDLAKDVVVSSLVKYPLPEFPDQIVRRQPQPDSPLLEPPRVVDGRTVVSYVAPVRPFGARSTAYLVVNVRQDRALERLFPEGPGLTFEVVVADPAGTVYYATSQYFVTQVTMAAVVETATGGVLFRTVQLGGTEYFVSGVRSELSDLVILHLQPTAVAAAQLRILSTVIVGSLVALLVAVGLLSVVTSTWLYRPVRSLLADVSALAEVPLPPACDEYRSIAVQVARIVERNAALGAQVEAFAPLLREHLAGDMLWSGALGVERFRETLRVLGLRFPRPWFHVALIDVESEASHLVVKPLIERALEERPEFAASLVSLVSSRRLSVLVNTAADNATVLRAVASVHAALSGESVRCTIAVSTPVRGLEELPEVLPPLASHLDRKFFGGRGEVLAQETEPPAHRTVTGRDVAGLLVRAVSDLRPEDARDALTVLRREIADHAEPTVAYARSTYFRIVAALADGLLRIGALDVEHAAALTDEAFRSTSDAGSIDELEVYVQRSIEAIVADLDRRRNTRQADLVERAKAYMNAELGRDVSLDEIAYAVRLSAGHLNALFREYAGCSAIEYLTARRMELAKRLLRETDQKVFAVARAVGYNSAQTFIRAFKRHAAQTPAAYRERTRSPR